VSEPGTIRRSTWGWPLVGALAASLGLAIPLAWVIASYFEIRVPDSLVYGGADGYCEVTTAGLGNHCWSDYAAFMSIDGLDPINSNPFIRNYPPLTRMMYWIFQQLGELTSLHLALVVYLTVLFVCLVIPAIWAGRRRPLPVQILFFVLIGVATLPFIAAMDRGNNFALVVPLLLVFAVAFLRDKPLIAALMVVILVQVKPQFIFLVVALIAWREWRAFFVAALGSAGVFLGSFLLFALPVFGMSPIQEFKDWVLYTRLFGEFFQPVSSDYPVNISMARVITLGARIIGSEGDVAAHAGTIAIVFTGVMLVVLAFVGRFAGKALVLFAAFGLASLFPNPVFVYYTGIALPIAALIVRSPGATTMARSFELDGTFDGYADKTQKIATVGVLATVVVSMSLILIPYPVGTYSGGLSPDFAVGSLMPVLGSTLWIVTTFWIVMVSVIRARVQMTRKLND
jgi:hypothetical protein